MVLRSASIPSVQLATGVTLVYTVPALFRATIKTLSVTNVNSAARTLTLYLIPSGGSASATNTIISAMTIPPSGIGQLSLAYLLAGQVLNAGDTIVALASAASSLNVAGGALEESV